MLILSPFIYLIQILYQFNVSLIDNYGWSLVLLSLEVTTLMAPLYYLAEKWKGDEEKDQYKMEKDITQIKNFYEGQKRYFLIREVHHLFHYRTIYSLRVTMGLLIQIPLFLAAYNYLSSYAAYNHVSFGPLFNLALPDHLLWGVNIMPLAMTIINLISSFIYVKGRKSSDKITLVVMALLFFVLLYDRPCGLVLYWTMNNLFGIPKNIWLKKKFPPLPPKQEELRDFNSLLADSKTPWIIWGTALMMLTLELSLLDKFYRTAKFFIPAVALLGFFLTLVSFFLWFKRKKQRRKYAFPTVIMLIWIGFTYLSYDTFMGGIFSKNYALVPVRAFILILQFFITGLTLHYILRPHDFTYKQKVLTKGQRNIFVLSLITLSLFYALISPVITYSGAVSDLQTAIIPFILEQLPLLFISICLGLILYFGLKKTRLPLVQFTLFLLLSTLVYYYIMPSQFGLLDGNVLAAAENLEIISHFLYILDSLILLGVMWLSIKLVRDNTQTVIILLLALLMGLILEFSYKIFTTDFTKETHRVEQLPNESELTHGYSRNETNVIVFIADMFTGGYMEYIKEDNPEVIDQLTGFTWYPNTLSLSYYTVSSLPAMIGGRNYAPKGLNSLPGNNRANTNESYYEFLVPMAEKGWNVSLVDPHQRLYGEGEKVMTQTYADRYYSYWKDLNHFEEELTVEAKESTLLTMLGLFQGAPYSLKKTIYSNGNWVVIPKKAIKAKLSLRVRKMWAYLDLLPEISHTNSAKPTMKFIHSYLTHMPYAIDSEGHILTSGYPDPSFNNNTGGKSAYYSAKEFMKLFTSFTNWLKEEDIYDNSIIILVSDHGNFTAEDDPSMPQGIEDILGSKKMYNRAHPVLIIKGLNETKAFSEDMTLMSNGDVIDIISRELDLAEAGSFQIERPLTFSFITDDYMLFPQQNKVDYQVWQVEDSLFNVENWTHLNE